jgi:hypothetical protein
MLCIGHDITDSIQVDAEGTAGYTVRIGHHGVSESMLLELVDSEYLRSAGTDRGNSRPFYNLD